MVRQLSSLMPLYLLACTIEMLSSPCGCEAVELVQQVNTGFSSGEEFSLRFLYLRVVPGTWYATVYQ